MNRLVLERRLKLAQRHAGTTEKLVARQRHIVGKLAVGSKSLGQAQSLLRLFEDLHRLCVDDERRTGEQLASLMLRRWQAQ